MLRLGSLVLWMLWLLGVLTGRNMGGFVHVLLIFAIILGPVSLVSGEN